MRPLPTLARLVPLVALLVGATAVGNRTVSPQLFAELEELSRLVAVSYCVGNQGIRAPFECGPLGWCEGFEGFELVETWNLGLIDSISCGYVALAHRAPRRIVVAFRGSNSLSDAVYDLMTQPAEYVPFPLDSVDGERCEDCQVHAGFMHLWNETRAQLMPVLESLVAKYSTYQLVLAGHSLGGAVAGLAGLETAAKGWRPTVTTYGEPRFGNAALATYVGRVLVGNDTEDARYRRVTHMGDPVPLLPFEEWGWRMHAGEIFIGKDSLPVGLKDVHHCDGASDPNCIRGAAKEDHVRPPAGGDGSAGIPGLPAEWRLWEILFSHRQYFWRIGLCWDPQPDYDYPPPPERHSDEL